MNSEPQRRALLEGAQILALCTGALYLIGLAFNEGSWSAIGVDLAATDPSVASILAAGFLGLFASFFIVPLVLLGSALFLFWPFVFLIFVRTRETALRMASRRFTWFVLLVFGLFAQTYVSFKAGKHLTLERVKRLEACVTASAVGPPCQLVRVHHLADPATTAGFTEGFELLSSSTYIAIYSRHGIVVIPERAVTSIEIPGPLASSSGAR